MRLDLVDRPPESGDYLIVHAGVAVNILEVSRRTVENFCGFSAGKVMPPPLRALIMRVRQIVEGRAEVENGYSLVVTEEGNKQARAVLATVFELVDTPWRGLGVLTGAALRSGRNSPPGKRSERWMSPSRRSRSRKDVAVVIS